MSSDRSTPEEDTSDLAPESSPEQRWQQISQLFAGAIRRPPQERRAYLLEEAPEDPSLVLEVERLLAADAKVRALVAERGEAAEQSVTRELGSPPKTLGPYRILRLLGRGGMGAVYLAARADDEYERIVAVKVLRQDLASEASLARFAVERQTLARLEHPNIARLYETGVTEGGRPFLVMEFVDGLPVDRYCDHHRLNVTQRIELFQGICAAVSHAHSNLLVHRDLKPSNILVTKDGRPVLLDFGIAKPLKPDGPGGDHQTLTGMRPMTPGYASPEQIRGEPITIATDVYTLGVLLYELLCGRRPYRQTSGVRHELERLICEQDAQRPSDALTRPDSDFEAKNRSYDRSQAASRRGSSPDGLRRELQGDLDAIVLKALRKEPERRYLSAERLSEDLQRHLEARPVLARPATLGYRLRRFVQRKRWAVAASAAIAVLITGSAVALSLQARRVAQERDTAQQALSFLVDVFRASDPSRARGETLTAREVLDLAVPRIHRELADQPAIQATLLEAVAEVYISLGFFERATPLLEKGLETRQGLLGPNHPAVASILHNLALTALNRGELETSRRHFSRAVAIRRRALGGASELLAASLNGLGDTVRLQEDYEAAEDLHGEALAIYRRTAGERSLPVAETLRLMADLADDRGEDDASIELLEQALDIRRELGGEDSPETAESALRLALALNARGRLERAEPLLRWALAQQRKLLPDDNRDLLRSLNALGQLLANKNEFEEAVSLYRQAIEVHRRTPDRNRSQLATCLNNLGMVLFEMGSFAEAAPVHREALELRREIFGERNRHVAQSFYQLGNVSLGEKDFETAFEHFRNGLEIAREALGEDHPHIGYYLLGLGKVRLQTEDFPAAVELFQQSWKTLSASLGEAHRVVAGVENRLGSALLKVGRYAEAEPRLLHSRDILLEHWDEDDPRRERVLETPLKELYGAWTPAGGGGGPPPPPAPP